MTKPKKKPKTGDVVGWSLVDVGGTLCGIYKTLSAAKYERDSRHVDRWFDDFNPHRICKIVLAK